jgi:hypothetical protein
MKGLHEESPLRLNGGGALVYWNGFAFETIYQTI